MKAASALMAWTALLASWDVTVRRASLQAAAAAQREILATAAQIPLRGRERERGWETLVAPSTLTRYTPVPPGATGKRE